MAYTHIYLLKLYCDVKNTFASHVRKFDVRGLKTNN